MDRIANLPVDHRGFKVPFFVAWVNGKPDHRIIDSNKLHACIIKRLCWVCGDPLGVHLSFVVGPMCGINRVSSEPPQHLECARYAVQHCPFLTRPHMRRREAGMPDEPVRDAAGIMLLHNPGVSLIWTTRKFSIRPQPNGIVFDLGDPESIEFWTEGRAASRREIDESIQTGLPELLKHVKDTRERQSLLSSQMLFERLLPKE